MKVTLKCIDDIIVVAAGLSGSSKKASLTIGKEYEVDSGPNDFMETSSFRVKDDDGTVREYPKYLFSIRIDDLALSKENWWKEIDELMTAGFLSARLGGDLRSMVAASLYNTIGPEARNSEIRDAKEAFPSGIALDGIYYDVAVFVPDDKEKGRQFFLLLRKWPNGTVKRIYEIKTTLREIFS